MYTIKLVYEQDIRKVHLESPSISSVYEQIKTLFLDLANVSFEDLYLYYFDNESDKIRIKFDIELNEALRYHQSQSTQVILKIFVQRYTNPVNTYLISPPSTATVLELYNKVIPMLSNPAFMQQVIPTFLPLITSVLNSVQNSSIPTNMSAIFPPTTSIATSTTTPTATSNPPTTIFNTPDPTHFEMHRRIHELAHERMVQTQAQTQTQAMTCEMSTEVSPVFTSVSTNTLIDAKDAATETLYGVTQTTQTQQQSHSSHQTTQTQQNPASATQTTQTQQNPASATQTTHSGASSQTVMHTTESQCQTSASPFYDSLVGTKFGVLLAQLHELGFTDQQKCVHALVKYGGNLMEAVDELLLDQLLV